MKSARKWLAPDAWERLADTDRRLPEGTKAVLAFDGSYSHDSTVLVGATVEDRPHVFVVEAWERPLRAAENWRVETLDVENTLAEAMEYYDVLELAPDPPGWRSEIEGWEAVYGETVVRFETKQPSRMGPAVDDGEQAVRDGTLTHDGNPRLAQHVANAVPVERAGYRVIVKSSHDSPDKIDLAVGFCIAHHRARWHAIHHQPKSDRALIRWA